MSRRVKVWNVITSALVLLAVAIWGFGMFMVYVMGWPQ